ncbi:hypothetical protein MMC06_004906 [Schaereria dolodes]|nr:hypothetical protein [Schaereria dolodes]
MDAVRLGPRAVHGICKACRTQLISRRRFSGQQFANSNASFRKSFIWSFGAVVAVGVGASSFYGWGLGLRELHADTPPTPFEVKLEKSKKRKIVTKEDSRDTISSQHVQVKQSWENPGVYAWGSNSGRVVAPDSDETYIKTPRRIPFFDGILLRDIKLDREFGAAVTEKGDLLQWGTAYSEETTLPTPTLISKDIISISISRDRILALSSDGKVYSLPVSRDDQLNGPKPSESAWYLPFYSTPSPISYRTIKAPYLSYSERPCSLSSGLDHALLLTTTGRIFSFASSSTAYPTRGQLGIPGLTWTTRPPGAYDTPHEIPTLRNFTIRSIACGDYHSLACDADGLVFAFGDNSLGQLGFDYSADSPTIDAPSLVPLAKLYAGTSLVPRVTSISAGGVNSFFTIDAVPITSANETSPYSSSSSSSSSSATRSPRPAGRITADTWACGQGIYGSLGTGRWTHMQGTPRKLQALSGLFEYDEATNGVVPIRLRRLSVGSTHAAATMDNVTHVGAHAGSGANDTNWGADVLWWGGNEHYQLGTGRRNNVAQPVYIAPLEGSAAAGGQQGEGKRRGEEHRFQITPRKWVVVGGRRVALEQRVECGRFVSAVYSGV